MPVVTVDSRPNGEPIATTVWPTLTSLELPSVAVGRSLTPSALMTATSVATSRPTIVALAFVPSLKATVIEPPSAAASTTWLFVRILPSSLMTTPVPVPDSPPPVTLIFTVAGRTASATAETSLCEADDEAGRSSECR